jgi:hypothetical protein
MPSFRNKPELLAVLSATCGRWLLHFIDCDPREIACSPPATHAEVFALYPDAVAAQPVPDTPKRKPTEAEAVELTRLVTAIYAHDNDTDPERVEALACALADPDGALMCYRAVASEREIVVGPIDDDDRRRCTDCANLTPAGRCLAAQCGDVVATRNYMPIVDLPRRCEAFAPLPGDPDQRTGAERWPGLVQK